MKRKHELAEGVSHADATRALQSLLNLIGHASAAASTGASSTTASSPPVFTPPAFNSSNATSPVNSQTLNMISALTAQYAPSTPRDIPTIHIASDASTAQEDTAPAEVRSNRLPDHPTATRSGRVPAPIQNSDEPIFDLDAYMNFPPDDTDDEEADPDFRPPQKRSRQQDDEDEYVPESDTASGDEEVVTAYSLIAPFLDPPASPTDGADMTNMEHVNVHVTDDDSQRAIFLDDAQFNFLQALDPAPPETVSPVGQPAMIEQEHLHAHTSKQQSRKQHQHEIEIVTTEASTSTPTFQHNKPISQVQQPPLVKRGRGRPRKDANADPVPQKRKRNGVLTADQEAEREQERKERNRKAAAQSRAIKKMEAESAMTEVEKLTAENTRLKEENEQLKQRLAQLQPPSSLDSNLDDLVRSWSVLSNR